MNECSDSINGNYRSIFSLVRDKKSEALLLYGGFSDTPGFNC